jgi:hypothetical protein
MEYAGSNGTYREPRWGVRLKRVACSACGLIREYGPDENADYELWYATEIFGERLWARNRSHLSFLIAWFSITKRRRLPYPDRVEVEIFPKWMILAKHRADVLNALERMAKS